MIPAADVTHWATVAPWATRTQVEQDLLLSRLICEIADHDYLGDELVFRGGTCFHKLLLPAARRYSEDLDYVRSTHSGISEITGALTALGVEMGFDVRTRVGEHPKVYLRTMSADGEPIRLKIEVNTHETAPALPTRRVVYSVQSPWWSGSSNVHTFAPAELVATKIRALYQRKKSRDLFDLWLSLTEVGLTGEQLLAAFGPYRPAGLTASLAISNLREKLRDPEFGNDLRPYVTQWPVAGYDLAMAADRVISDVLSKLR